MEAKYLAASLGCGCINSQSFSVAPEQFQIVVVSIFAIEYVYHDVDKIEQNPACLFIASPAKLH